MALIVVDPRRVFEVKGQVCPLTQAVSNLAIGADQVVVAAVSGRRIRVMGWLIQSATGVVGTFNFKSGVGGPGIIGVFGAPPITAGVIDKLPIIDPGYAECAVTTALVVDIALAAVNINLFFIAYPP